MKRVHVVLLFGGIERQCMTVSFKKEFVLVLDVIEAVERLAVHVLPAPLNISRASGGKPMTIDQVVLDTEEDETYVYWWPVSKLPSSTASTDISEVTYFS